MNKNNTKPIIGITMGDPAGVGSEIIAKLFANDEIFDNCKPLVIGDARVIQQGCSIAKKDIKVNSISDIQDARMQSGIIDVLDLKNISPDEYEFGKVQKKTGLAAGEAIQKTIELCMSGQIHAATTCPIHKDAFQMAGFPYAGHTEMFGEITGTTDYRMMLVHGNLRVIHNTAHVSLKRAIEMVSKQRLLKTIELAHEFGKKMGLLRPNIAVCGLNPHSSDDGLFGDEEEKEIIPTIKEAQKKGISVVDKPIPSDTAFAKAAAYNFDIIVALYHDQGHIPVKCMGFKWNEDTKEAESLRGVNLTVGLPIIRTSVDHGVAFGRAGKGYANHESLIDALNLAVQLAKNK